MVYIMNLSLPCNEFYDKIKNDTTLLKKMHSSEKYDN